MGRSPCCDDNSGLKKGPWTPEEDDKLTTYIEQHGHGNWRALPKAAGLNRCGKSCRLRWTNYLRPDIKRGRFTEEEEDMIVKLHSVLGNKWSRIAAHLQGRTDNEIKNYWNTHLRKKLLQMGIDPVTHKPRTDLNFLSNLSQLISPPNMGMNPWDNINNALRLQPNVADLAKLQVLQNVFQILNTSGNNFFPNMNQNMPLNLGMFPNMSNPLQVYGIDTINNIGQTSQGLSQIPNHVGPSQVASENYDSSPESFPSLDTNDHCYNKSSLSSSHHETLDENKLPSLVTVSPEGSSAYTPANGDYFEGLEKILDYGTSDYWKELLY